MYCALINAKSINLKGAIPPFCMYYSEVYWGLGYGTWKVLTSVKWLNASPSTGSVAADLVAAVVVLVAGRRARGICSVFCGTSAPELGACCKKNILYSEEKWFVIIDA